MMSHPTETNVSFRSIVRLQNGLMQVLLLDEHVTLKKRKVFLNCSRRIEATKQKVRSKIKQNFMAQKLKDNLNRESRVELKTDFHFILITRRRLLICHHYSQSQTSNQS